MKRITLVFFCLLILQVAVSSAHAQLGVYGEYSATHIPGNTFTGTTTSWYQGFTGGVYDTPLHAGPLAFGLDVRGSFGRGQGHNYHNFLIGPRIQAKPPLLPIRPYIQAAVGFGGVQFNGIPASESHYSNKLQYGVLGGVDWTLVPHIDLRPVEISYLRMSAITSGPSASPANLVSVGTGVVVRF